MTIRVLLADDQEMVRAALRAVIDRREDLCVVNRILTRLGLENRVQAAILARDAGPIPPLP
ncbi:hypothetical protein [Actinoallomurus sp. NPDC052274]|uniref:hypothetical protein n=1 Tax=Actinoallomurus sp. NPDC052274 TaxID=3155420 RepID=UPI0034462B22